MTFQRLFPLVSVLICLAAPVGKTVANPVAAPANLPTIAPLEDPSPARDCPLPALERLRRHTAVQGETVESIARQYNVIPATLMAMNPMLRRGRVSVGSTIVIPPYDGRLVEVPAGSNWQKLAETYKVRPDLLFEANGCKPIGQVAFIPSVNWSPEPAVNPDATSVQGFPLATPAVEALRYGWQTHPVSRAVFFHSGIDFLATEGTQVLAAGGGTVAFAGPQGDYGNLVVVNHQAGKQTRYAHLRNTAVKVGQTVQSGEVLGTVGTTGKPDIPQPHLHFEVRYNTGLGWVAEDPKTYLQVTVKK
ncbi:MAG TPA: peptidase [Microcoleaceae bacterium UBA10368]|jgi:Membrane proteins related to metalloendopeptidases|nr:peptidase [Microcoleaceae cyanobacterium UBA10368]HCV30060.1 peptidase [Microcoleaceae cyanobacterium UBA9251]